MFLLEESPLLLHLLLLLERGINFFDMKSLHSLLTYRLGTRTRSVCLEREGWLRWVVENPSDSFNYIWVRVDRRYVIMTFFFFIFYTSFYDLYFCRFFVFTLHSLSVNVYTFLWYSVEKYFILTFTYLLPSILYSRLIPFVYFFSDSIRDFNYHLLFQGVSLSSMSTFVSSLSLLSLSFLVLVSQTTFL